MSDPITTLSRFQGEAGEIHNNLHHVGQALKVNTVGSVKDGGRNGRARTQHAHQHDRKPKG
jgi:hypothetical protein